jgi:hypothetical protein
VTVLVWKGKEAAITMLKKLCGTVQNLKALGAQSPGIYASLVYRTFYRLNLSPCSCLFKKAGSSVPLVSYLSS